MDDLNFILEDQKYQVAKERGCLEEEDPPYMTIKTKTNNVNLGNEKASNWESTQRTLPNPAREENSGLSLQLGTEYEQKKQRLQEELRLDYRRYVAKKKDVHTVEPDPQAQGGSLPIGERRLAKDKLRDERNKEYNLFLKRQSGQNKRNSSNGAQDQAPEPVRRAALYPPPIPEDQHNPQLNHVDHPWDPVPSKRDAATLTDRRTKDQAPRGRRRWVLQRPDDSLERWERRRPRRRGTRRDEYTSEEDIWTEDEELEFLERRRPRRRRAPEYMERGERRVDDTSDRVLRERRVVEPAVVREEDARDRTRKSRSATPKPIPVMPVAMKTVERSRSADNKDKGKFATGLIIGTAEEGVATQRRKERYRQELLEQMAEGRSNRKKEKDLELRVAATGAVDPEKQPDCINLFGAANREYEGRRRDMHYRPGQGLDTLGGNTIPRPHRERLEANTVERGPPERPRVAFPSPPKDHTDPRGQLTGAWWPGAAAAPLNEDFHRSLSSTLAEMVTPRFANLPPPLPPTLTDTYRTPYDEAYYYYGARNPLDPTLPYYGSPGSGVQTMVLPHLPPGMRPLPGHEVTQRHDQHPAAFPEIGLGVGLIGERPKQSKEKVINYQEALRLQIQEKEKQKREEREWSDRYDARVEAESKAYDPWGKGGGGAPLRDDKGNLISDLNRMHRTNEEAYVNPESRNRKQPQPYVGRGGGEGEEVGRTPRGVDRVPSAHRLSGFSQLSQFARGSMFSDHPTPLQLQEQESYKTFLKQQIEEKRKREAEEKERKRLEEEREERMVAEQRVCIQKEFQEEQERKKRKEIEQSTKNKELIRQAEERRREAERKSREEDERESETLRQQILKAETQRIHSPPIPSLQKKLDKNEPPRPPSAATQPSSMTLSERSVSAPHSPPVPARRNQLRATDDKQQGVISELSSLRRKLRSEQRLLEGQLLQRDREDPDTPLPSRHRGHPRGDVFEMARIRAQGLSRRGKSEASAPAQVTMQNFREFNQLKYRDSMSREVVRHVYPDPPGDELSLDLQQQALIREQQRMIRNMRREPEGESRHKPPQSAFSDYLNREAGSPGPVQIDKRSRKLASQEEKRPVRRDFQDGGASPGGQRDIECNLDGQSLSSVTSQNKESPRDHNQRSRLDDLTVPALTSGGILADELDDLSLQSAQFHQDRCVSVETVATEPWLRAGTPDTLKRFGVGQHRREAGY
ncbi:hypothetical protein UPYG_G00072910 [Umbra pygmaea]|uniref:Centrosome and spindle pole-associated protein 1 C-terminal domain-containing protein n=1 Tax=Umbra pygmaea TaxID=75934 RepID=A0ABD0XCJ9_UMBPY